MQYLVEASNEEYSMTLAVTSAYVGVKYNLIINQRNETASRSSSETGVFTPCVVTCNYHLAIPNM